MTGPELKKILSSKDIPLKELSAKLGILPQQLSVTFKSKEIKTGLLEKICEALNVQFDFFYDRKNLVEPDYLLENNLDYKRMYERLKTVHETLKKKQMRLQGKYEGLLGAYNALVEKTNLENKGNA